MVIGKTIPSRCAIEQNSGYRKFRVSTILCFLRIPCPTQRSVETYSVRQLQHSSNTSNFRKNYSEFVREVLLARANEIRKFLEGLFSHLFRCLLSPPGYLEFTFIFSKGEKRPGGLKRHRDVFTK
jgi:hypothetical protein